MNVSGNTRSFTSCWAASSISVMVLRMVAALSMYTGAACAAATLNLVRLVAIGWALGCQRAKLWDSAPRMNQVSPRKRKEDQETSE